MTKICKKAAQHFHCAVSKVFDRVKSVTLWSANIRKLAKDHKGYGSAARTFRTYFFTLPDGAGDDKYEKAVSALDTYFKPQANSTFEDLYFKGQCSYLMKRLNSTYITRLRQRAETCEFGDRNAIDERIRDQVVDKFLNHSLRRKLLEKGRTLNLTVLREITKTFEDSARQDKAIENHMQAMKSDVNRVQFVKKKSPGANSSHNTKPASICYSCGFEGHLRTDPKCPTRGKKCRKCSQVGHFEKQCKTKDRNKHFKRKRGKVQQVSEQPPNVSSDDEYAFSVNQINSVTENIAGNVGNVDLKILSILVRPVIL
jgi:hypothetical protein